MDWTGAILTLFLFIFAIMFLLKKNSSRNNSSHNLPPGPRTIPILGNLHMMDLKRPYRTLIEWSKEYGPIFRIKLGLQEMVVLTGYETVKEALVNQADAFADRPVIPIFEDAVKGYGKVQEEIAREIGDIQPRTDHRAKMPYTDAVIHEIQRFGDIVPSNLPHSTTMDITLKGFFIPKGTYIIPLLTSVLHDESQWEKPHEFYPEHFLDSEGKFVKRDAFMPFSAGRRICAGETLAKMELFLFFTSLLQKFTFHPPPGTSKDDLDLTPGVGLISPPMPYKTCAVLC
ncbi:cytochrome P450 2K6-like [Pituophis catenifer annectens]|uniref:cytochrome P450 2K6-like n=1 Tax=Pituophis catenifer annectens TaxID=94852 RepID=UPI003995F508